MKMNRIVIAWEMLDLWVYSNLRLPVRCWVCRRWMQWKSRINLLGWIGKNFCSACAQSHEWRS